MTTYHDTTIFQRSSFESTAWPRSVDTRTRTSADARSEWLSVSWQHGELSLSQRDGQPVRPGQGLSLVSKRSRVVLGRYWRWESRFLALRRV